MTTARTLARRAIPLILLGLNLANPASAKDATPHALQPPPGDADASEDINRALQANKNVQLSCGLFHIGSSIRLPSSSSLVGSGPCTILVATANMRPSANWPKIKGASPGAYMMVTNDDFENGNSSIKISDLSLDATKYPGKGHIIGLYRTSHVTITHISLTGGPNKFVFDGVAMLSSKHYSITHNLCTSIKSCCFDNWDANSDFTISNNKIVGVRGFSEYGITINGTDTTATPQTSYDGRVQDNQIENVDQGIFVAGLRAREGHGTVARMLVSGNRVKNADYHGIRVADGHTVNVVSNDVDGAGWNCLIIGSEGGGGTTTGIHVESNKFNRCGTRDSTADAVTLYAGASKVVYKNNLLRGSSQRYSIRIDSTVHDSDVEVGNADPGRLGTVQNSGKNITIR